ncbi:hypothetical protein [Nocardia gipuzkoensis]
MDEDEDEKAEQILSDGGFYDEAPWEGVSCASHFWPFTRSPEHFEVRRAVGNITPGARVDFLADLPYAGANDSCQVDTSVMLRFVQSANAIAQAADEVLHEVVAESRVRGATWEQIGNTLGVNSRTAPQKRFGKGITPQRLDELRHEGVMCSVLHASWIGQIPLSTLGFDADEWDDPPIEVYVDHAVRSIVFVAALFDLVITKDFSDNLSDSFEKFIKDLGAVYKKIEYAFHILALPQSLECIVTYSGEQLSQQPWTDDNAPLYFVQFANRVASAFHYFNKLWLTLERDDTKQVMYYALHVRENLYQAQKITIRPEFVAVVALIEQEIEDAGNVVYGKNGNLDQAAKEELLRAIWDDDLKKAGEVVGLPDVQEQPSLEELLRDLGLDR